MNRTVMMLLMQTEGRPTLNLKEVASLLNMQTNSLLNRIYDKRVPFAMFQLEGSSEWLARVDDVAAHIDAQRDAAVRDLANHGENVGSGSASEIGRSSTRGPSHRRKASAQ